MTIEQLHKPLHPLIASQREAVVPADNIWLSASAGTGKTQVLTARVIRLLLEEHVDPENLLCITFTKAGAAEMAERINQLLASWVQLDDKALFKDLEAIGAKSGPQSRQRASELFAKVLDAPGGGLQILTIHSFCQSLLGSFPEEAGLVPGFKPVEGREQQALLNEALAAMVLDAEARNDDILISHLQSLSLSLGEEAALKFLHKCVAAPDVMAEIPQGQGATIWARRVADVGFAGSEEDMLEEALADTAIDRVAIISCAEMNMAWGKGNPESRGGKRAQMLYDWLAMAVDQRVDAFASLHGCWSNSSGEPMISSKGYTPIDDAYSALALELYSWTNALTEQVNRAKYADRLAQALLVGKAFSEQYARAKHAAGVVDFDDMIRKTAALLSTSNMAEWVRFKLDRQIDHILVDEAQDTNKAQWDIIRALSDDFYSGSGARSDKTRTIFSVGDFKQAIYGFQGTAPERYREAGESFADRIDGAGSELRKLALSQSFRSTAPVLDFVNAVISTTGPASFGIEDAVEDHYSEKPGVGQVELLAPVTAAPAKDDDAESEEDWIGEEKRRLAELLADHAKALIDESPWLISKGRRLRPGDIMFLLRSRGDIASLLVAQLHERGVPVAGVDRLRLLQPLVVQDLVAVIRFVLQPGDDLSLACILVSPLIGWTQDKLLAHGYRGDKPVTLWQHLRSQPEIAEELAPLRQMLAAADFTTVYHFLEQILSGPIGGRRKFAARLGSEALVPIEEMLNAAIQFEQQYGGSLQKFLAWFDRGDMEIKREGESGANEVRVMTVHGAKGLQAPVVILADTTSDPTKKPDQSAELLVDEGRRIPLLPIRKAEQSGQLFDLVELQKKRELEEHRRLLYVAITRAEERLIMGGSLGVSRKGEVPDASWYLMLEDGMSALGCAWQEDKRWGRVMRHVGQEGASVATPANADADVVQPMAAEPASPAWLFAQAPDEERPPRPLVPSRLDDDDYGDAPISSAMRAAAERGKLIHSLFERVNDASSLQAAEKWLATHVRDDSVDASKIFADVKAIASDPEYAAFFSPAARAEVPLAAVVGETVISGRIDRLVVEPGFVRAIDFKTGRTIPGDESSIPVPHLRQMAHYAAALQTIFPDSKVEISLLFTAGPRLITLSDEILAPYKPAS